MENKIYYFDNNATTRVDDRVLEKMLPYFSKNYANPSSIYRDAQTARGEIDVARQNVAGFINADPAEIVFTSCGTESNNTAIKGSVAVASEKGNHIITSQIEHHAVLNPCKYLELNGYEVTWLPVDRYGLVDPDEVRKAITGKTILISIMYVNNEIGIIEPLEEIGRIANEREINFHTDAVQAVGKMEVDVKKTGADFLSLSAHKIYGPKGMGALYVKSGTRMLPLLQGGHHEKYRRAGTENVPGIIGLGEACRILSNEFPGHQKKWLQMRDKLKSALLANIPDIVINEHPEKTLPNTLSVSIKGLKSRDVLMMLDRKNIYLSAGSACATGLPEPSHVLKALGFEDSLIHGTLRISLGQYNSNEDIDYLMNSLQEVIKKARA